MKNRSEATLTRVNKGMAGSGLALLAASLVFALSAGLDVRAAHAQGTGARTTGSGTAQQPATAGKPSTGQRAAATTPANPKPSARPYFVEFRARSAASYGHTFLVHGKVSDSKKITPGMVAGLHPFTESSIPWMIGHLVLVPSETGASDGDTEEIYVIARYRVLLTEAEYRKALAYIKDHQKNSPVWHAALYNCNAWVGDVASYMGLKTAPRVSSVLLMPQDFINNLKDLNGGRQTLDSSFAGGSANASAR